MDFEVMNIVYYSAVILFSTKLFGMITRKFGLPQVVGMILAGLIIGPAIVAKLDIFGFKGIINPSEAEMNVLKSFSQIGVIFILFSSGLETDFKVLKKSGAAATCIAFFGVIIPLLLGTVSALMFMGGFEAALDTDKLMNALFVGCILTATSVGITVETMRELGKLNTKLGTTILSAAIIDDVIGILLLSIVTGMNGEGNLLLTILKSAGFFLFSAVAGILMRALFKYMVKRYPHKRRTSVFAIAMCFAFAFCAEEYFGIAAITGAYMAGLMLSGLEDTSFVDRKVVVSGYMIFTPMFFAFIGISADFSSFTASGLLFAAVFVLVGIIGKILGCGAISKCLGFNTKESITVGCGMIARGEVALAVYSTGQNLICRSVDGTVLGVDPLVATIFLIVITSVLCPIFLKIMFRNSTHEKIEEKEHGVRIHSEAIENFIDVK